MAGPAGHSLLTAFPYKCGSLGRGPIVRGGVRESVAVDAIAATDTVSQRRVAIEVAGLAVWGGAQRRTKLTDEQVPLPLLALAPALPLEQGSIGLDDPIGPTAPLTSCYPSWGHLHSSTSGRQGSAVWAVV